MLWEELSSKECKEMSKTCGSVCLLPMGIIEKHGDHLPIGTDMYTARAVAEKSAELESAVVFPYYFLGLGSDCMHYTGAIGASRELIMDMLLAMCDEISRNGYKKILIVNSHGGNKRFLEFFAQTMPTLNRDYTVYVYGLWNLTPERRKRIYDFAGTDEMGSHAGLSETSLMMHLRPELVHTNRQEASMGQAQNRLEELKNPSVYTGLSWYGDFPYHFAGDHSQASPELGKVIFETFCENLGEVIQKIKQDTVTQGLFDTFGENVKHPL